MTNNKYILVTGSSSGLGNAVVQELSRNEYNVFAGVRTEKDKLLFNDRPNIIPLILDVTKPETISAAFQSVSQITEQEGLYAIINNAGINYICAFELAEENRERELFEVNLFGAMNLTRKMLPLLHRFVGSTKAQAKIINISSIGGIFGLPWEASYHASKFAMLGFSQSLRYELELLGISVCCFLPGGMKTGIFNKSATPVDAFDQKRPHLFSNYYLENEKHMRSVMMHFEKSAASPQRAAKEIVRLLQKRKMPLKKIFGADATFIRILHSLGLTSLLKGQFVKKPV